jgi:hypothetical protein
LLRRKKYFSQRQRPEESNPFLVAINNPPNNDKPHFLENKTYLCHAISFLTIGKYCLENRYYYSSALRLNPIAGKAFDDD